MTANIEAIQEVRPLRSTLRSLLWVSPLAMLLASAANLALYAAVSRFFPAVSAWSGAGPGQIIGATIVYLFFGTLIFALVARFSSRPARHFLIIATVGLLLSLWLPASAALGFGPPGVPAPGVVTAVTLSLMHIISYMISVPLFIKLALN